VVTLDWLARTLRRWSNLDDQRCFCQQQQKNSLDNTWEFWPTADVHEKCFWSQRLY